MPNFEELREIAKKNHWIKLETQSIYSLEIFISNISFKLDQAFQPDEDFKIRFKFLHLPCVEIDGTFLHRPEIPQRASVTSRRSSTRNSLEVPRKPKKCKDKKFNPKLLLQKELEVERAKSSESIPQVSESKKLKGRYHSLDICGPGDKDDQDFYREEKQFPPVENLCDPIDSRDDIPKLVPKVMVRELSYNYNPKASNIATCGSSIMRTKEDYGYSPPIPFNDGKTICFNSTPSNLMYGLNQQPLLIYLFLPGPNVLGFCEVPLDKFSDGVLISVNTPDNNPVMALLDDNFEICFKDQIIGKLELDLRLTCLGSKIIDVINPPNNPNDNNIKLDRDKVRVIRLSERPSLRTAELLKKNKDFETLGSEDLNRNAAMNAPIIWPPESVEEMMGDFISNQIKQEVPELKYVCTDWETVLNMKTMEDLIKEQKGPFQKGSPYYEFIEENFPEKINGGKIGKKDPCKCKNTKKPKKKRDKKEINLEEIDSNASDILFSVSSKQTLQDFSLKSVTKVGTVTSEINVNIAFDSKINSQNKGAIFQLEAPIDDLLTPRDPYTLNLNVPFKTTRKELVSAIKQYGKNVENIGGDLKKLKRSILDLDGTDEKIKENKTENDDLVSIKVEQGIPVVVPTKASPYWNQHKTICKNPNNCNHFVVFYPGFGYLPN